MIPALLAGCAAWCLVPVPPRRRARRLWSTSDSSGLRVSVEVWALLLTPLVGYVIAGWPWGLIVGMVAAPLVKDTVRKLESPGDRKRATAVRHQLPGGLDLMSAALAAGRPPATAVELVALAVDEPLASELMQLANRLRVAGDIRSAVRDAPDSLNVLTRALARASESGAPIAEVVASAADDVRRDARADRREAARRVGVRTAAPLGLCFLPAFLLVGIVPTVISIASTLSF